MKIKKIIITFFMLSISSYIFANDEPATNNVNELFPFAAQSHNKNGEFDAQWGANIYGSRNNTVDFKKSDNLQGICDGKTCAINNKLVASYNLRDFNDGKKEEETLWYLDTPTDLPTSHKEITCNPGAVLTDSTYKVVTVNDNKKCTISADSKNVIVSGDVSVAGTLYLKPGNYWFKNLNLKEGKIEVVKNQKGEVNI